MYLPVWQPSGCSRAGQRKKGNWNARWLDGRGEEGGLEGHKDEGCLPWVHEWSSPLLQEKGRLLTWGPEDEVASSGFRPQVLAAATHFKAMQSTPPPRPPPMAAAVVTGVVTRDAMRDD
eukprot:351219-Chlamydomonas_euryale.AAC.11